MKLAILSRLLGRRPVRGPGENGTSVGVATAEMKVAAPSSADSPAATSPASSPAFAAPAQAPRRRTGGSSWLRRAFNPALRKATPPCLLARLENGVEVIFILHSDGRAERVQEVPESCPLILSATVDDLRLVLPEALPYADAKSRLIRETASYEKLGVVSAGLAVYGTQTARIAEAHANGKRLAPLSALADRLVLRHQASLPAVTGFVFGEDAEGAMAIAVFFAQLADGKTRTYLSISPENLHAIYLSFITSLGLPEETEPVVFTQVESMAGLAGFYAAYPAEADVLGIPAPLIWRGALATATVLCVLAGGWWWEATNTLDALKAEAVQARTRLSRHVDAIGHAIAGDLPAFNRLMGLAPRQGLSDAEALYLPGSRVESTLSAADSQYDVFVPLRLRATDASDDPDARSLTNAFALSRRGCQRTDLDYSGALDEIRIRFRCPGGNAAAAPFRG